MLLETILNVMICCLILTYLFKRNRENRGVILLSFMLASLTLIAVKGYVAILILHAFLSIQFFRNLNKSESVRSRVRALPILLTAFLCSMFIIIFIRKGFFQIGAGSSVASYDQSILRYLESNSEVIIVMAGVYFLMTIGLKNLGERSDINNN